MSTLDTINPVYIDHTTYYVISELHPMCAEDPSGAGKWLRSVAKGPAVKRAFVRGAPRLLVRKAQLPLVRLWAQRRAQTQPERGYISDVFAGLAAASEVFKPIYKGEEHAG